MGDRTPSANARGLRESLVGLGRFEQHPAAYQWAVENGRVIDMFGTFAQERHLLLFQSGNECENWIDPLLNVVYKMNMLVHVGEDILKLLDRIDLFNMLFPATALHFVGFHATSPNHVYPVFAQPFIPNAQFSSEEEIAEYMLAMGFHPTGEDGKFSDGKLLLFDMKPKNVLRSEDGTIFVIDAEIEQL